MNLQAEISWIQAELSKVKEPHLIEAFKQLLKYRNESQAKAVDNIDLSLDRAIADKEAGRVKPHNEVKAKYEIGFKNRMDF